MFCAQGVLFWFILMVPASRDVHFAVASEQQVMVSFSIVDLWL